MLDLMCAWWRYQLTVDLGQFNIMWGLTWPKGNKNRLRLTCKLQNKSAYDRLIKNKVIKKLYKT